MTQSARCTSTAISGMGQHKSDSSVLGSLTTRRMFFDDVEN